MNDKTREQIEAMKNQTIGVEIEMNNITREKAARKVAEYFGTRAWNAASEYGYYSWACKDGQGRVWKFQRDVSIYGPDAEKCELVTPILTYDDIETLQEIIRLLRKAGAKSGPSRGCGVHIHIGKGDHTAKTIRNLVNIMAAHEQQIGRAIRIDAGRTGQYCQVVNHRFLDRLNRDRISFGDELCLPDIRRRLDKGEPVVLLNRTTGEEFPLAAAFSRRQVEMLLAGGLLNYTREQG